MKKNLLFITGLIMAVILPVKANAASLKLGDVSVDSTNSYKTTVPVIITVGADEQFTNATIKVTKSRSDATMELRDGIDIKSSGNDVTSGNSVEKVYTYTGTNTDGTNYITNGVWQLLYIEITNTLTSQNDITLTISGTVNGKSFEESTTYKMNAYVVPKTASSNSKFSNVKVSQGTMYPSFSSDITEYTVYNISDKIASVKFSYDCDACSDNGLRGGKSVSGLTATLNQGENVITLECVSEDNSSSTTYTFKVLRGDTGYNSSKLSELEFEGYTLTPTFDSKTTEYTLTVPNKVNSLVNAIKYKTTDENATVTTEGLDNLVVGENKLTLTVNNVNGDESTLYTVTVKRMSLDDIEITKYKDGKITFKDSEGVETTLEESEFKTQYPEEYEKIQNKEYTFDDEGNLIIDDKSTKETTTEEKKKSNKTWIIVLIIVFGLAVIGVSGYFIFRKKKPNDKNKKNSKKEADKEEIKETNKEDIEKENSDEKSNENSEDKEIEKGNKDNKDDSNDEEKFENTDTMNIDEALSDLMNTKQYNFKDKDE